MSENIIMQLRSQYQFLTKVEKKIADLVFADPEKFTTYSTAMVAKLCDVSHGSINNFAKKFIPEGFSFFKLEVARCVSYQQDINEQPDLKTDGDCIKTMELKIRENISALCNTLEINEEKTLNSVVEKILTASKIEVLGIFQSGIVAQNFSYKLIELGIPASHQGDSLMLAVSSSMLKQDDLVIAISASGETKDIVDAVKMAKSNGVYVISLTENKFSPLAKLSDDILLTTAGHGRKYSRLDKMRMSQLLLVDTICACIYQRLKNSGKTRPDRIKEILESHNIKDNN